MSYQIEITPAALESLEAITDRGTRSAIVLRIDVLSQEPERIGKSLRGLLTGFMSIRAAGQRYRVVYRIDASKACVGVHMIGIRKEGSRHDIYELAEHLVRRGLI
jgi:mRNA interferase RelE/StbE